MLELPFKLSYPSHDIFVSFKVTLANEFKYRFRLLIRFLIFFHLVFVQDLKNPMSLLLLKLRKIKRWIILYLFTDFKPCRPGCRNTWSNARVNDNLRNCCLLLFLILEKGQQLIDSWKTAIKRGGQDKSNLTHIK